MSQGRTPQGQLHDALPHHVGQGPAVHKHPPELVHTLRPAGERQEKDTTPHTQQGPAISQGPRAAQDGRREQAGRKGMFLGSRANGGGRPQRRGLGTGSRRAVETRKAEAGRRAGKGRATRKPVRRQGENEEGMGSGARGGKGGKKGRKRAKWELIPAGKNVAKRGPAEDGAQSRLSRRRE